MGLKVALVCFSVLLSSGALAETVSLKSEDISRLVKERNQHALGAQLLKESAEAGRGHLKRSFLPRFAVALGSERYRTGTQTERSDPYGLLSAKVNVFRGGRDRLEDDVFELRARATAAETEKVLRGEIREARARFWNLVSQREIIRLLEEATEENQKNLSSAQGRIRAGAATETDRIEFEMHGIELEQDLARLRLASEVTERELSVLLGFPEDTRVQTLASIGHEHKDELLSREFRVEDQPTVSSLNFKSEEAKMFASKFQWWWAPSLDFYASYGLHTYRERDFEPQSERLESVVGLQFTMELFDGFEGRVERRQKTLEAASFQKEAQQTARELRSKIEGARAELELTHDLIHKSEEALKRSKQYLHRTLDEYRRGVKNSPDVLSAAERNFAMRRRFAELRRDYQLARASLIELLGD